MIKAVAYGACGADGERVTHVAPGSALAWPAGAWLWRAQAVPKAGAAHVTGQETTKVIMYSAKGTRRSLAIIGNCALAIGALALT